MTWPWDEALVALNLAVAPALERTCLLRLADGLGDPAFAQVARALAADGAWHRAWCGAALATAAAARPEPMEAADRWRTAWGERAAVACEALESWEAEHAT